MFAKLFVTCQFVFTPQPDITAYQLALILQHRPGWSSIEAAQQFLKDHPDLTKYIKAENCD